MMTQSEYAAIDQAARCLADVPSSEIQLAKALATGRYGSPVHMVAGYCGVPIEAWRAVLVEAACLPHLSRVLGG